MPTVDFEVAPGRGVPLDIFSVVIDNILHLFVLLSKKVQRMVTYVEIVTRRYRFESKFRLLLTTFFVGKICVSAIGASWIQTLDTILLE